MAVDAGSLVGVTEVIDEDALQLGPRFVREGAAFLGEDVVNYLQQARHGDVGCGKVVADGVLGNGIVVEKRFQRVVAGYGHYGHPFRTAPFADVVDDAVELYNVGGFRGGAQALCLIYDNHVRTGLYFAFLQALYPAAVFHRFYHVGFRVAENAGADQGAGNGACHSLFPRAGIAGDYETEGEAAPFHTVFTAPFSFFLRFGNYVG